LKSDKGRGSRKARRALT